MVDDALRVRQFFEEKPLGRLLDRGGNGWLGPGSHPKAPRGGGRGVRRPR